MFMLFAEAAMLDAEAFERAHKTLRDCLREAWKGRSCTKEEVVECLGEAATPELRSQLEIAQGMAPLLATSAAVSGNPRIVKRLLNTVRLRKVWAEKRGIPLQEEVLAKIVLFERCTDETAYSHLIRLINEAPDGRPELLGKLESMGLSTAEEFAKECPEEWSKHSEFVRQWCVLEPGLAGRELRSALYLSRDAAAMVHREADLSPRAGKVLEALRDVKLVSSAAARTAARSLDLDEARGVMEIMVRVLREAEDWKSNVPGFNGAVILANEHAEVAPELAAVLSQIPPPSLGTWLGPALEMSEWAAELLAGWQNDEDCPIKRPKRRRVGPSS